MHILIAEDNITNAKVIQLLIRRLGHTCELAEDGTVVLEKVRSGGPFDVILMDLQMPNMDGHEATRRLIAEFDCPPPVVAFTANAFDSDRTAARESGMIGFLAKPVTAGALQSILSGIEMKDRPGSSDPSIDFEQFEMIMDGGDEESLEIFDDFCRSVPGTLARMGAARKSRDWESFARDAHQLKGTYSTFGLAALSKIMGGLEQEALSGELELNDQWLETATAEFQAHETRLRSTIASFS
jgi:CheY-like chemotaxis protein